MNKKNILCILTLAFLIPGAAFAWNGTGHMIAATIAYHRLSPAARTKFVALLQQHSSRKTWIAQMPKSFKDAGLYLFMRASTWPDDVRTMHVSFDTHPNWHFVDYPLTAPAFTFVGSPTPQDDILFGLNQAALGLKDNSKSAGDRAMLACWLLHLVGDIHQPLHCATWVDVSFPAPEGDRGGNEVFVKPSAGESAVDLHAYWDRSLGTAAAPATISQQAAALEKRFTRTNLTELAASISPDAWSRESRTIAITTAYRSGNLARGRKGKPAPLLPKGYAAAAKAMAERRIALAGYRLADQIEALMK